MNIKAKLNVLVIILWICSIFLFLTCDIDKNTTKAGIDLYDIYIYFGIIIVFILLWSRFNPAMIGYIPLISIFYYITEIFNFIYFGFFPIVAFFPFYFLLFSIYFGISIFYLKKKNLKFEIRKKILIPIVTLILLAIISGYWHYYNDLNTRWEIDPFDDNNNDIQFVPNNELILGSPVSYIDPNGNLKKEMEGQQSNVWSTNTIKLNIDTNIIEQIILNGTDTSRKLIMFDDANMLIKKYVLNNNNEYNGEAFFYKKGVLDLTCNFKNGTRDGTAIKYKMEN